MPLFERGDIAWLRQQLERFTYRPNWIFSIGPNGTGEWGATLTIEFLAPDARPDDPVVRNRPNAPLVPVRSTHSVPYGLLDGDRDERFFAEWLRSCIQQVEDHESREWLRRDGQIYDDPHINRGART